MIIIYPELHNRRIFSGISKDVLFVLPEPKDDPWGIFYFDL